MEGQYLHYTLELRERWWSEKNYEANSRGLT
jgi:hypothetical protein